MQLMSDLVATIMQMSEIATCMKDTPATISTGEVEDFVAMIVSQKCWISLRVVSSLNLR